MRRATLVALAAVALTGHAASAISESPAVPHDSRVPPQCTVQSFRPFSAAVWRLGAWQRGNPPPKVIQAQRRRLRCAPTHHRAAMVRTWERDRRAFFDHRSARLWQERVTPEPGPGGSHWAIPWYIVECESGGDYTAQNPTSSAYGAYQMLASTYAAYCSACDWSPRDQDLAARRLYVSAGTSPWACG